MKTPRELAAALTQIVASACQCEATWPDRPVTSHEYAEIYAAVYELLEPLREAAISEELKPTPEEIAQWERIGEGGA